MRQTRPFRNPHHTASAIALVGGGSTPRPGEISLAHKGVLFLDELAEFDRKVLDVLRQPLESGEMIISRANQRVCFPADFQLIAAMNPCPSGYKACTPETCRCSVEQVKRYKSRVSGPLLDRIDIHIEVPPVPTQELAGHHMVSTDRETSKSVAARVQAARNIQQERAGKINAALSVQDITQHCLLAKEEYQLLTNAMEQLQLSARSYHKILKLARTIADLAGMESIARMHVIEAISLRNFDRSMG